jgi:glutamate carboxypeptidase
LVDVIKKVVCVNDYAKQITVNVGTVQGGSVVNRVPHLATADVEMRAFNQNVFQESIDKILSLNGFSSVASQDGYACQVIVEMTSRTNSWPRNSATMDLYNQWENAASVLGYQTILEERGGLSDGNLLWNQIPTLDGLGPSGDNAHCSERSLDGSKDQEYVLVSSIIQKALINIQAIINLLENQRFTLTTV